MKIKNADDLKQRYVAQKTKDLREFGYSTLTKEEVADQYDKVNSGETDLNVIGRFIEADFRAARIGKEQI